MIVGMYFVAIAGLVWLAYSTFRHAGIGDLIVRVPGFLLLGFFWVVCVIFGGLLLGAFAETANEQELPAYKPQPESTTFTNAAFPDEQPRFP